MCTQCATNSFLHEVKLGMLDIDSRLTGLKNWQGILHAASRLLVRGFGNSPEEEDH